MDADELEIALPTESQLHPCMGITTVVLVLVCIDIAPLHAQAVCLSVCLSV